jgi:hypothetical protein
MSSGGPCQWHLVTVKVRSKTLLWLQKLLGVESLQMQHCCFQLHALQVPCRCRCCCCRCRCCRCCLLEQQLNAQHSIGTHALVAA